MTRADVARTVHLVVLQLNATHPWMLGPAVLLLVVMTAGAAAVVIVAAIVAVPLTASAGLILGLRRAYIFTVNYQPRKEVVS